MRAMIIRLRRDAGGATAIEYGLIAGLVALGIIGSLVTTKGSLNAIFGTASSKMAAGGAQTPSVPNLAASTSPREPYWLAKGITAAPTVAVSGTKTTTTYTFKDGTVANFSSDSATGGLSLSWLDPNYQGGGRTIGLKVGSDAAGYTNFVGVYGYQNNGAYISDTYVSTAGTSWSGTPPMPATYVTSTYNASGQATSVSAPQSTGTFAPWATMGYQDMAYFMDLAKQQ